MPHAIPADTGRKVTRWCVAILQSVLAQAVACQARARVEGSLPEGKVQIHGDGGLRVSRITFPAKHPT
jgi:hypothetical protein